MILMKGGREGENAILWLYIEKNTWHAEPHPFHFNKVGTRKGYCCQESCEDNEIHVSSFFTYVSNKCVLHSYLHDYGNHSNMCNTRVTHGITL